MENSILNDLKTKEKELYNQLQSSMLFKQWEGLKSTILLYEKPANDILQVEYNNENIPTEYDSNLTWADKVLFGLSRIKEGFPEDITNEIMKFETVMDSDTVFKNVRGKTYQLLNDKKIKIVKKVGRKSKLGLK